MKNQHIAGLSALIVMATTVSACGGSNGGVSSISPPVAQAPTPLPPPPPPPVPPPPPSGPNGLVSSEPFTALGISQNYARDSNGKFASSGASNAVLQFRYIASENAYEMSLPGFEVGRLKPLSYGGTFTSAGWITVTASGNALTVGTTAVEQNVRVSLTRPPGPLNPGVTFTHTSWGGWNTDTTTAGTFTNGTRGLFTYGIPTASGDVPVTGTAFYKARVIGSTTEAYSGIPDFHTDDIDGTARLNFDFAAGTLTGSMEAQLCPWDCYDLGRYDFTQTVYATGSRTFSGKFMVPGSTADSFFEGAFNGPKAAELMARWQAPYLNPETKVWGSMFGIWVGKKE